MADHGLEGSLPVDLSKRPPPVQNFVSTVNLDCKLDLTAIALQSRNAEYNPKRFDALIMRIRQPKTTALIFASGKIVCTGAKSETQSKLAARKYARIIQKLGFGAKFKDFKIKNIIGSARKEPSFANEPTDAIAAKMMSTVQICDMGPECSMDIEPTDDTAAKMMSTLQICDMGPQCSLDIRH